MCWEHLSAFAHYWHYMPPLSCYNIQVIQIHVRQSWLKTPESIHRKEIVCQYTLPLYLFGGRFSGSASDIRIWASHKFNHFWNVTTQSVPILFIFTRYCRGNYASFVCGLVNIILKITIWYRQTKQVKGRVWTRSNIPNFGMSQTGQTDRRVRTDWSDSIQVWAKWSSATKKLYKHCTNYEFDRTG